MLTPFIFPTLPATWYIGHMSRALREIQLMIQAQKIDLIIETRDARLPLTSINPAFEHLLKNPGIGASLTKRLIVYNKADLAQECFQEPLKKALYKHGQQEVIFTDSRSETEVKKLLKAAIRLADRPLDPDDSTDRISMLMAGMPNVGKSSLLNALRRSGTSKGGKPASVSSEPGHTRRLSTTIKASLDPPVYVHDTPGIMVPFLGRGIKGNEAAVKLALTAGIKQSLFEQETLTDYLIWRLKGRCLDAEEGYTKQQLLDSLSLPANTSLDAPHSFLEALAVRLSAVKKGAEPDLEFAGRWLIHAFREGKLGKWTLDGLGRGGEAVDVQQEFDLAEERGEGVIVPTAKNYLSAEIDQPNRVSPQVVEEHVDEAVKRYLLTQAKPSQEDLSGHQAKKAQKADHAKIQQRKRQEKAVAKVSGPGGAISSGRRRKYRR